MSRRLTVPFLSALLLAALPAAANAQDEPDTTTPMWQASVKQDAQDVAPYADGFALVGGTARKPSAKIWLSADGDSWSAVPKAGKFDGVTLRRVTGFGDGIVALGTDGRKLVSLSSMDGATWKKSTLGTARKGMELFPDAVTEGPAGLLAVASMVGQDLAGQRFYASTDGVSWERVDPPSDTVQGFFVSLAATDDEYIAVARPMFMPATDLYWRSPDARTWEPFDGPEDGYIHDLAIGEDGSFVGVGQDAETFLPAIWHATELGDWEQVYALDSGKETEERLEVVSVGGPGFLAGGITSSCPDQASRYCPSASILASADGVEWQALGVEDGVPGPLHDTAPRSIAGNAATTAIVAWHDDRRPTEAWLLPSGA